LIYIIVTALAESIFKAQITSQNNNEMSGHMTVMSQKNINMVTVHKFCAFLWQFDTVKIILWLNIKDLR
jgi:hypothetical protein